MKSLVEVAVSCLVLLPLIDAEVLRFQPNDLQSPSVVQALQDSPSVTKPWFCHDLGCPQYSVIKTTDDYEVRRYVNTNWVTTSLTGADFSAAQYTMFMRLFRYISGANVKREKIAMTCPVLVRIIPGQGPTCANNFTMSFFNVPAAPNPPAPTDSTVYFSRLPQQTVYVSHFGGFANKDKWIQNAAKLLAALQRDKVQVITDHYYTAGYDSPFRLFNRHNEVWFIGK